MRIKCDCGKILDGEFKGLSKILCPDCKEVVEVFSCDGCKQIATFSLVSVVIRNNNKTYRITRRKCDCCREVEMFEGEELLK